MNFFSGFFKAISNCFIGFGVLFEKGLWPYLFYPLILWVLLLLFSIYGSFKLAANVSDWLTSYIDLDSVFNNIPWLAAVGPYVLGALTFLLNLVIKILFWFISGTFIKYVLLIILSPLFALLSERTDEKLTGNSFPFSGIQLIKDIFRGIAISLRNMLFEYFFIITCFCLTFFFPPLIVLTAPFLLFAGWYFAGFTLLDYNSERYRFSLKKSILFMKQNRGYACGIGFVYSVFMALPFIPGAIIGLMLGPTLAVIGGTIGFLEIKKIPENDLKN